MLVLFVVVVEIVVEDIILVVVALVAVPVVELVVSVAMAVVVVPDVVLSDIVDSVVLDVDDASSHTSHITGQLFLTADPVLVVSLHLLLKSMVWHSDLSMFPLHVTVVMVVVVEVVATQLLHIYGHSARTISPSIELLHLPTFAVSWHVGGSSFPLQNSEQANFSPVALYLPLKQRTLPFPHPSSSASSSLSMS